MNAPDGLRWTSRELTGAPAAWRGGPGELVASEDVGGAAGPGTGRAGLEMLLSAERLVGESSLDDDAAGDKARRRAETDATLEDEHERQKSTLRTGIRNSRLILVSFFVHIYSVEGILQHGDFESKRVHS